MAEHSHGKGKAGSSILPIGSEHSFFSKLGAEIVSQTAALTEDALREQIISTARSRLNGFSRYELHSERCDPPHRVNCIEFALWVLGQHGFPELKRDHRQLLTLYHASEESTIPRPGDLVFTDSPHSRYHFRVGDSLSISHVGIVTERNTVIHASQKQQMVIEEGFFTLTRYLQDHRGFRSLTSIHTIEMVERYAQGNLHNQAADYARLHMQNCRSCRASLRETSQATV